MKKYNTIEEQNIGMSAITASTEKEVAKKNRIKEHTRNRNRDPCRWNNFRTRNRWCSSCYGGVPGNIRWVRWAASKISKQRKE